MGIINFMKGVYRRMFPLKDIASAIGRTPIMTDEMQRKVEVWRKSYFGKADWVDGDKVISLRIESSAVRELANVALNEMSINISNDTLEHLMNKVRERLNVYLQRGLALGAMVIKPLGDDKFQCIPQNGFIIFEMDADGNPIDIAFPEMRTINKRYYTRVERHTLTANGLIITNKAYVSDSEANLGREIPLDSVEEWSNYVSAVVFPIDRMIFGYYRNPNDNTVDGTEMGVSIYDSALEKIRKADIQFGRLDYEFESARRRIHADTTMIKQVDNGAGGKSYHLDDIYIDVNGDKEDFFNEFSPSLRQDGFIAGLEEYRRDIEFDIGLSYGDLSNPQYVEKTATEINTSKCRKRNTINHIQSQLRVCLDGLAYGFAFFNRLTTSGYEFSCEFKDSFLNDDQSEREEDRKDLANGTLRREEYRARWRNETLEEAEKNLPEVAELSYAYTE